MEDLLTVTTSFGPRFLGPVTRARIVAPRTQTLITTSSLWQHLESMIVQHNLCMHMGVSENGIGMDIPPNRPLSFEYGDQQSDYGIPMVDTVPQRPELPAQFPPW